MHRRVDWEVRLAAFFEQHRARVFAWGSWDCCHFAAGSVEAMTGVDPMPEFRGKYRTAAGAARALKRHGAGTLSGTLDRKFTAVPAALARRGDIIMSDGLLGLCWGAFLIAVGSDGDREGLIRIAREAWIEPLAWRVGE